MNVTAILGIVTYLAIGVILVILDFRRPVEKRKMYITKHIFNVVILKVLFWPLFLGNSRPGGKE